MAVRINEDSMSLEIDNHFVATARLSEHAAADGKARAGMPATQVNEKG
jgi:hypothetical protein